MADDIRSRRWLFVCHGLLAPGVCPCRAADPADARRLLEVALRQDLNLRQLEPGPRVDVEEHASAMAQLVHGGHTALAVVVAPGSVWCRAGRRPSVLVERLRAALQAHDLSVPFVTAPDVEALCG